ncbi:MAG: PhoX family phosphatase [Alkalinema sp. RU_4_3]|nr:PhoX family phosphatase [Alkalinema sp. RU_4_3]
MSQVTRRQLLAFFTGSAAATVLGPQVVDLLTGTNSSGAIATPGKPFSFTPVRLPHPLPIYQQTSSYLATNINQGSTLPQVLAFEQMNLNSYTPIDDVVVPPEYERYVIARWGDRFFSNSEEYVGYNCDYTGFVPLNGNDKDGYLWINHEYVGYPISRLAPEVPADIDASFPESGPQVIPDFPTVMGRALLGEFLYNMGGSILRLKQQNSGRYQVQTDSRNRRLHALSGLGINADRRDEYKTVTQWGSKSYQKGDQNYLIGTGPAATEVFTKSSDGLGNRIIGTGYNCSGGTTPWGTILSAEENFQGSSVFFVGVTEGVKPDGTQTGYTSGTTGSEFGLVGEKYGWMVEVDPANPNVRSRKHTALGRFRHENIAFRSDTGKPLVAYMGDDRRGGHTWKYVSRDRVSNPNNKDNSKLFETGTLYVAKFNENGTGEWIPLQLGTKTNPNVPSQIASVEISRLGVAQRNGRVPLPRRQGIAAQTSSGGSFNCETTNETTALPGYRNKTLADFYQSQGAILCDAFLAANLVGGTPSARPEDLEVNPRTKEVFIAYTDGAPGGDGYPDSRIFVVAKYSGGNNDTQQSGGIYKIIENSADGTGLTFRWQRLVQGGEAGSINGAGFASVDNLAFDDKLNLWGVTDMSTSTHNGFDIGAKGAENRISHADAGNVASYTGIFGNNWLFYIPTTGTQAGQVVPFAYGPPRSEMTGPTFVDNTLIISVQHPGEDCPYSPRVTLKRQIEMLALNGSLFYQTRSVSRGSNWPSNIEGRPEGPPGLTVSRHPPEKRPK